MTGEFPHAVLTVLASLVDMFVFCLPLLAGYRVSYISRRTENCSTDSVFVFTVLQEECASLKRRLEKEKKNVLYGAADEILLEEIKQYKVKRFDSYQVHLKCKEGE